MSPFADFERRVTNSIQASILVKEKLLGDPASISSVARVSEVCIHALRAGKKLLLFGNGGSAADAEHMVAEFVGRFSSNRPPLAAVALSVNASSVTAISNDYGFETVFSRQIEALGSPGDVAIGISTSGDSGNVLQGISTAKKLGLHTVGFTGTPGGKLKHAKDLDLCVCIPSSETPRVQECHILVAHIVCELVEEELFPGK